MKLIRLPLSPPSPRPSSPLVLSFGPASNLPIIYKYISLVNSHLAVTPIIIIQLCIIQTKHSWKATVSLLLSSKLITYLTISTLTTSRWGPANLLMQKRYPKFPLPHPFQHLCVEHSRTVASITLHTTCTSTHT